jgi:colicin import membrane protein
MGVLAMVTCARGEAPSLQTSGSIRDVIAAQRQAVERKHAAEVAACYQQFFVNECSADARRKRNEAMAEFKRQEVMLNDEARRVKTAEQVGKREERLSVERQEAAAQQRNERTDQARQRQQAQGQREDERQQAHRAEPSGQGDRQTKSVPKGAPKEVRKAQPPAMPMARVPDAQSSMNEFNLKQQEAAQRKADLEKSRSERTKPLASPLPAAGATSSPLPPAFTRP